MLRSVRAMIGAPVHVTDGKAGRIRDLFFDDEKWVLRYLVVDCGGFLVRDEVLVSPIAVSELRADGSVKVNLSREQLERSPSIDTRVPIPRRVELEYHRYYNWPSYWSHSGLWATGPYGENWLRYPGVPPVAQPQEEAGDDSHLRSVNEVTGYRIHGTDRTFGHVEDFVMDDETWAIRYLVVDTRNWLPSKSVLIASQWVDDIRWELREVHVPFTREVVRNAPAYEPEGLNEANDSKEKSA